MQVTLKVCLVMHVIFLKNSIGARDKYKKERLITVLHVKMRHNWN